MRFIRSLSALAVLTAALAGAPWLLWQVGKTVFPDRVPSAGELWNILTSRDSGATFMGLLIVVGTVAWAVFTICVVLEIVARIGGRTFAWRIPGLKVPQRLASGLISMVIAGTFVLSGQSAAIAAPSSSPPAATVTTTDVVVTVAQPAPSRVAETPQGIGVGQKPSQKVRQSAVITPTNQLPTVTVHEGDSLWRIAERHLGDPLRYGEIAAINIASGVLSSPEQWLEPGWVLQLPRDAKDLPQTPQGPRIVVVQDGDTLSEIAHRELGSADRYPEIADLNALANPDVIDVGQKLRLPDSSDEEGGPEVTVGEEQPQSSTAERTSAAEAEAQQRAEAERAAAARKGAEEQARITAQNQAKAKETQQRTEAAAAARKGEEQARAEAQTKAAGALGELQVAQEAITDATAPSPGLANQQPGRPAAAPPTNDEVLADDEVSASSETGVLTPMIGLGLGSIAVSVLWGGLVLRRRRQGRRRRLGEQPVPASLHAAEVERQVRQQASAADVDRLDRALRTISLLASDDGDQLPDVTAAWLSNDGLHLKLAVAAPVVGPFEATGTDWWLPADVALPDVDWTEAVAPWPALASIGAVDGESVLVDLEHLGAIRVSGDPQRIQHWYNHLAVELAHSTWSDGLQVVLVGWGEALETLAPDKVEYEADLDATIARLWQRLERIREFEESLATTVLGGRMGDIAGEIWSPQVLLISPAAAQNQEQVAALDRVLETMAEQSRATVAVVAAVCNAELPAAVDLTIDESGQLRCPAVLGDQQILAASVDEALLSSLVELLAGADDQQSSPPAIDPEPWASGMAASGALLESDGAASVELDKNECDEPIVQEGKLATDVLVAAPTELPIDIDTEKVESEDVGSGPAHVVPLRAVSPAVAAMLEVVLSQDPTLDSDLEEWHSPAVTRPKIAMLGTPQLRASGKDKGRRETCIEIALYLALYRQRTNDQVVTDLWPPDRQPSAETRRWWFTLVRGWLGEDEQRRPYLAYARRGVQELTDRLLDLDLLRRLRKRGEAWASAGDTPRAYQDLQAALKLVRGPVLHHAPATSYAWLANPDRGEDQYAPLWIVQIAHQAVDLALQLDDLDGARAAAEIAHQVAPYEDSPLTDLVRVAQAAGRQLEAQQWARAVLRQHSAEVIEDIENTETMLVLSELFPRGLRLA